MPLAVLSRSSTEPVGASNTAAVSRSADAHSLALLVDLRRATLAIPCARRSTAERRQQEGTK